jgi:hypothetical protein
MFPLSNRCTWIPSCRPHFLPIAVGRGLARKRFGQAESVAQTQNEKRRLSVGLAGLDAYVMLRVKARGVPASEQVGITIAAIRRKTSNGLLFKGIGKSCREREQKIQA